MNKSKIDELAKMGKVKMSDLTPEEKNNLLGIKEPSKEELEAIKNDVLIKTSGAINKALDQIEDMSKSGILVKIDEIATQSRNLLDDKFRILDDSIVKSALEKMQNVMKPVESQFGNLNSRLGNISKVAESTYLPIKDLNTEMKALRQTYTPPFAKENQELEIKQDKIRSEMETDPSKIDSTPDSLLKNLSDRKILNEKPQTFKAITLPHYDNMSHAGDRMLEEIKKLNSKPDSRYLKFFDGLLAEDQALHAKKIVEHFKYLDEAFNDLFQFISWKVTSDYSGYFLSRLEDIEEEYKSSNFRIKSVCLTQNVTYKTKMIVFDLKYYAGYFVDSENSESFVLLDENEEFNELTSAFEFVDDSTEYFIENHISSYYENYPDKLPENIDESEATEAILAMIRLVEPNIISFDENKLNTINQIKDLEDFVRSTHRLKKNGCVAGFKFKLSVSVEDTGKEFVLSRKDEIKEILFLPPQSIVISGKQIKLSKSQYFDLSYFLDLESNYKNEWVHLDDFIDYARKAQIDEIGKSNKTTLRSSFVRLRDKLAKNGFENIVLIDGFKVRINSVAKI